MDKWTVNLQKADIVGAFLLLCFSAIAVYATTTWLPPNLPGDPGAAFFPRISLGIMFLFSLVLGAQKFRGWQKSKHASSEDDAKVVTIDLSKFFWTIIFSGLLVAGIAFIGFEIAASVFLFALLGVRTGRWSWSLITSIIATAIMYFIFVIILKVRLNLLFLPAYLNIF